MSFFLEGALSPAVVFPAMTSPSWLCLQMPHRRRSRHHHRHHRPQTESLRLLLQARQPPPPPSLEEAGSVHARRQQLQGG